MLVSSMWWRLLGRVWEEGHRAPCTCIQFDAPGLKQTHLPVGAAPAAVPAPPAHPAARMCGGPQGPAPGLLPQ